MHFQLKLFLSLKFFYIKFESSNIFKVFWVSWLKVMDLSVVSKGVISRRANWSYMGRDLTENVLSSDGNGPKEPSSALWATSSDLRSIYIAIYKYICYYAHIKATEYNLHKISRSSCLWMNSQPRLASRSTISQLLLFSKPISQKCFCISP